MRARDGIVAGLATAGLLLIHTPDTAWAKGGRVRAAIERLRGDIAQLSNQLSFMQRDAATYPAPGVVGLCDDPCATDSDQDGIGDCEDYCPCDPNTADGDGDFVPDCADPCPDDATDACIDPCNVDSDGDGITDCEDPCPWDPAGTVDSDDDGIVDCQDPCPGDPENLCWEPCLLDVDGDGVPDCDDACPWDTGVGEGIPLPGCLPPPMPLPMTMAR